MTTNHMFPGSIAGDGQVEPVKVEWDPAADWTNSGVSPNTPMYDMIIEIRRQNDEILAMLRRQYDPSPGREREYR